jgi:dephospho-CoA kinase
MKVYGLTGGVGMGKSTTDKLLRERGVAVVDTDIIARQVVEPGQPALDEISAAFGSDTVSDDGQLRRDELARRVFSDPAARSRLEAILHPRIRTVWQNQVNEWRGQGISRAVVVIPLLYETNAQDRFDKIICVACTSGTQRRRLAERGWPAQQVEQRIRAQWPVEKKMELAHYVIWTEAGMDVHAAQLDRIIR